jgi:hypothetical protein
MIALPCSGNPAFYLIDDAKLESLAAERPRIDVTVQLLSMQKHLVENPYRQGPHAWMPKRIAAWLDRSVPSCKRPEVQHRPMIGGAQDLHRELVAAGDIPSGFQPRGQSEKEQIASLHARAHVTRSQRESAPYTTDPDTQSRFATALAAFRAREPA